MMQHVARVRYGHACSTGLHTASVRRARSSNWGLSRGRRSFPVEVV